MHAKSLVSWHYFAFLIVFGLLAALGWEGKRTQEAVLETNRSVSYSLEIITATQAILSSLQDIETGSRGFVLTGEQRYLEPYERGLVQLEANRRALQILFEGRDYQDRAWFEELDLNIVERLIISANNIQARRDVGLERAAAQLQQTRGKDVMDRLRALLDTVEQRERAYLAAASLAVEDTIQHSRRFALVGSLMVTALFLAAMWAIRRNLQIREALTIKAQAGKARLRALLQAIPDSLYSLDREGRVSALSRDRDSLGLETTLIEPVLLDLLKNRSPSQQQPVTLEVPSSRRVFELRLVPTGLGDHLAIARDVTEVKRSRETLEEQQLFLRRVVDTDDNLIFVRDDQGRFLLCNSAFAMLLDSQPAAIEQRCVSEVAGADLMFPLLEGEAELIEGHDESRTAEVGLIDADGQERWFLMVKRPMTMPSGTRHIITVAVDISLRRRVEQMKNEFISTVSHELRTPLTAIRGALGMLVSGVMGGVHDSARPLLDIANKNSERLVRLINDILDFEKVEAGRLPLHFSRCNVQVLIERALADLKPYGDEYGVTLKLALPDALFQTEVDLDPDRFAQVMANLLSNAIKHSPTGGVVSVDLHSDGSKLEVGVRDQGEGVPENFRSRIFERFAQADSTDARKRGGTGLGLAITHSLVRQMHGRIGFDSNEGQGARFWFTLPVAP